MDLYTHFITSTILRERNKSFDDLIRYKKFDFDFLRYVSCAADVDNLWRFFKPDYKPTHIGNFHYRSFEKLNEFSLGLGLHGEVIKINGHTLNGLDYYTHRQGGYIELLRPYVDNILEKYNLTDLPELSHGIVEFVTGHYLIEKYNEYDSEFRRILKDPKNADKFISNIKNPYFRVIGKLVKYIALPILKKYLDVYENLDDTVYSAYVLGKKEWLKYFKPDKKIRSKIEQMLSETVPVLKNKIESNQVIYKSLFDPLLSYNFLNLLEEKPIKVEKPVREVADEKKAYGYQ